MNNAENVYRQFKEFEERAAAIYLQLASQFAANHELSSFWLEMALHEKQHAGLLEFCLLEHLFASEMPDAPTLEELTQFFQRLEKRAADPTISVEDALALAIELEASELNAIYCNLTTPLHRSLYLLHRKVATSIPNHIDELITAATKFGVSADGPKELIRLKETCAAQWRPPE